MKSLQPITILFADDHAIVRQGLCALLRADGGFHIVAEASDGREAVSLALALRPDVIVMDIAMPVLNGLEATRQILATNPAARVAVLSAHGDDEYIQRMLTAGAVGFLEKQSSAEVLTKALRAIAKGKTFYSPSITRRLADTANLARDHKGLIKADTRRITSREYEVLQLVAEGSANKQIAGTLGISIKTVEKHRQHLMDKLGIHDTAGLTRHAIATGVIESAVLLTIAGEASLPVETSG